jgi:hypothetical protein
VHRGRCVMPTLVEPRAPTLCAHPGPAELRTNAIVEKFGPATQHRMRVPLRRQRRESSANGAPFAVPASRSSPCLRRGASWEQELVDGAEEAVPSVVSPHREHQLRQRFTSGAAGRAFPPAP